MDLVMPKSPERRRREDARFDSLNNAVESLKTSHIDLNTKIESVSADVAAVKRDTAAIIQEFIDRRNRQKALTFYSRSIECIVKRVVRPLVIILLFIAIPVYVLAAGHLPGWFKALIEYMR